MLRLYKGFGQVVPYVWKKDDNRKYFFDRKVLLTKKGGSKQVGKTNITIEPLVVKVFDSKYPYFSLCPIPSQI